mmetsp:Transcript_44970/g.59685  ORF Transcript_44970/g.59685 Transcript_44970/m.59685 type:complete len:81 (-) Transcript_44970:125-367(-)
MLPLPDSSHDWSAKTTDECIVDTWALAKIHKNKKKGKDASKDADKGASKSSAAESKDSTIDLGHPLLNKAAGLGVRELLV